MSRVQNLHITFQVNMSVCSYSYSYTQSPMHAAVDYIWLVIQRFDCVFHSNFLFIARCSHTKLVWMVEEFVTDIFILCLPAVFFFFAFRAIRVDCLKFVCVRFYSSIRTFLLSAVITFQFEELERKKISCYRNILVFSTNSHIFPHFHLFLFSTCLL